MAEDGPHQAGGVDSSYWNELAQKHWTKTSAKPKKVKPEVIKKAIWDVLEREQFDYHSLVVLENLQILEWFVWMLRCFTGSSQSISAFVVNR